MSKRSLIGLLALVLLLCAADTLVAQTYTCTVENQTSDGTSYTFDVYMLRTSVTKVYLGDADFAFTFTSGNFTSPTINWITGIDPTGRIESSYGVSPAIVAPGDRIVISVTKPAWSTQGQFDSRVDTISTQGLGTLIGRFTVSGVNNPGGTAGLAWRLPPTTPNETVVFTMAATTPWASTDVTSSGTYTAPPSAPLPVQISSFAATVVSAQQTRITWTTLSETENYGFEVQRSLSKTSGFASLPGSFVAGHGTTVDHHDYAYIDATAGTAKYFYRLKQIDMDATVHYTDPIQPSGTTDVKDRAPVVFALMQNYPNPFNPSTEIKFSVENTGRATVRLYNILGAEVSTLFDGMAEAGQYYRVRLDGSRLASGVYFYRLESEGKSDLKKMVLLK